MNADVATVAGLLANPGSDGISIREALEATNNDPSRYAIRFAPSLAGRTIALRTELPPLDAGGVSIDGDIEGDDRASVTLLNGLGARGPQRGVRIASGGNSLRALSLQGFAIGVLFEFAAVSSKLPTARTYGGNTVTGLAIKGARDGIFFGPDGGECEARACPTHNRWTDIRIVDNTIEARSGGIDFQLGNSIGDRLERLTVTGNTIRLAGTPARGQCMTGGVGVNLTAGEGSAGVKQNRISDALIARNSIEGNPDVGIRVVAGSDGGDANTVERIRIVGNRVQLRATRTARCERQQILIATGDGSGAARDAIANQNVLRDIEASGNSLGDGEGVRVVASGAGGTKNTIRDVRIKRNTIRVIGPFPGVLVYGGGGIGRASTGASVSDVVVDANRITISGADPAELRPVFGGISVVGGDFGGWGPVNNARIERVRITNNRIDTRMLGISLVGGFGGPEGAATGNVVFDVTVAGNQVVRMPMRAAGFGPETRGINLAGGIDRASGNRVACVRARNNRVAGVGNAVSVVTNVAGASGNRASLSGC